MFVTIFNFTIVSELAFAYLGVTAVTIAPIFSVGVQGNHIIGER
jgi:hypothetical protein